jgi:dynein heavy chain, axonemal
VIPGFTEPEDFNDAVKDESLDPEIVPACVCYGYYFDGCKWDFEGMTLADQDYGVMWSPGPLINFIPVRDHKVDPADYVCPFYKTSVRAGTLSTTGHSTNFVLPIELPTLDYEPSYWILKGAALVSMLND